MRRLRTIFILAPVLLAAVLWAASHWRYSGYGFGTWGVLSESGAVYLANGRSDHGFLSGSAREFGTIEQNMGTDEDPRLPLRAFKVRNWRVSGRHPSANSISSSCASSTRAGSLGPRRR